MSVERIELPELRLACVRHVGPYPEIGSSFGELSRLLAQSGLSMAKEPRSVAVYYDDPGTVPAERLRSDAAYVLRDNEACPSGLNEGTLPAGNYARMLHMGPYHTLSNAWDGFCSAIAAAGMSFREGASFEWYMNDCSVVPDDQIRTDLYMPVE